MFLLQDTLILFKAVAILPSEAKEPHVILQVGGKIVLTAILPQTSAKIALSLMITQTEEKHYFASRGKIAASTVYIIHFLYILHTVYITHLYTYTVLYTF